MIDRRRFIGTSVAGGVGAVVAASGCAPAPEGGAPGASQGGGVGSFELDEATVADLQAPLDQPQIASLLVFQGTQVLGELEQQLFGLGLTHLGIFRLGEKRARDEIGRELTIPRP